MNKALRLNKAVPRMLIFAVATLMLSLLCMPAISCSCEDPAIVINSLTSSLSQVEIGQNVTFTASATDMDAAGGEPCTPYENTYLTYSWSGGGSPATATGTSNTFTTNWNTTGWKTVTVSVDDYDEWADDPVQGQVSVYVHNPLTVTIDQAVGQVDPTASGVINFSVVFSEAVTNFNSSDVTLGGTAGATTATVTGSGTTYNVAVSGMTQDGTVTASIGSGRVWVIHNGNIYNKASTSTDNVVTYDIPPTVTIEQAYDQDDPTATAPVNYTVIFNKSVTGFETGDVSISGSSGPLAAVVTGSGTMYNVAVTGMPASGNVVASIPAGVAYDSVGFSNVASTSTDNTVAYTATAGMIWSTKVSDYCYESIAVNRDDDILAAGTIVNTNGYAIGGSGAKLDATNGSIVTNYSNMSSHPRIAATWYPDYFFVASWESTMTSNFSASVSKVGVYDSAAWAVDGSCYYAGISNPIVFTAVDAQRNIYVPYTYSDYDTVEIRLRTFTNTDTGLQTYTDTLIDNTNTNHGAVVGGITVDQQGGVYVAYATRNYDDYDTLWIAKKGNNPWTSSYQVQLPAYTFTSFFHHSFYYHDWNTQNTPIAVSPSGSVYIAHHYPYDKILGEWVSWVDDGIDAITRLDVNGSGAVINETGALLGGDIAHSITGFRPHGAMQINGIAVRNNGEIDELYFAGVCDGYSSITATSNAYQQNQNINQSTSFVGKMNGSTLGVEYLSYLGPGFNNTNTIALDSSGQVYVDASFSDPLTNESGGYVCKVNIP